ncbi:FliM/FliN family flagellar motor switch protein [Aliiroseovarius sp. PTFE2010]|uniref:FliM/FliN family flagellar motor switch protein n=1 Tax=Aliiroseovarius sp. PTFE2010 TaxID=3417190 RepID=UPI003CEA4C7D
MSDASTIQRKAGAGRPQPDIQAMSAAKALRLALSRTAEVEMGLAATIIDFSELRLPLGGIAGELPKCALIAMITAEDGARGLFVLDHVLMAALIEQMTTGAVRNTAAEERVPTSTDAALASALIDKMLARFETLVSTAANPPDVGGYRYATPLRDPRAIGLTLDDQRYRYYRLTVDLAQGAKTGDMLMFLPLERPVPGIEGVEPPGSWQEKMEQTVSTAEVTMDAALYRLRLSLSDVMGFEVGQQIPVPRKAVAQVQVEGIDGRVIATARLGQANGLRALRINDPASANEDDTVMGPGPLENPAQIGDGAGDSAGAGPMAGAGDLPPLDGGGGLAPLDSAGGLPPLGAAGDLPPLGGAGDLPPLEGAGDLPPLGDGGLPPLSGGDLPPLGDAGDLPPLGDAGDLPPLGDAGGLPPLGDAGGLPPLGDAGGLPPLSGGDGLPPLDGDGLPPLPAAE